MKLRAGDRCFATFNFSEKIPRSLRDWEFEHRYSGVCSVTDKNDERLKQRRHRFIVTMRTLLVLASILLELHLHLTGKYRHLSASLSV